MESWKPCSAVSPNPTHAMAKLKTHQATAKRVVITKRGKLLKRKAGQNHFNARERGMTRMGKRRDVAFDPRLAKTAQRAMPYR